MVSDSPIDNRSGTNTLIVSKSYAVQEVNRYENALEGLTVDVSPSSFQVAV